MRSVSFDGIIHSIIANFNIVKFTKTVFEEELCWTYWVDLQQYPLRKMKMVDVIIIAMVHK